MSTRTLDAALAARALKADPAAGDEVIILDDGTVKRTDVDNLPSGGGAGVPDGGTTGQVLGKISDTDGDADWITPAGGGDMLSSANLSDLADAPTARTNLGLGTAATTAAADYATSAQGDLADTATQPGDLATVATTGAYGDLAGTPDLSQYATVLTPMRTDATATITLDAADLGRTVFATFDGAVAAEVAASLPAGWWCEVIAANTSTVVTITGDTGVSVVAAPSAVSEDQWSTLRCLRTPTADQVHVTGRAVES